MNTAVVVQVLGTLIPHYHDQKTGENLVLVEMYTQTMLETVVLQKPTLAAVGAALAHKATLLLLVVMAVQVIV
jgi:hypothetical protein